MNETRKTITKHLKYILRVADLGHSQPDTINKTFKYFSSLTCHAYPGNAMRSACQSLGHSGMPSRTLMTPRPASQLPGPKAFPVVGSLPYMMRHPAFDPQRIYLYWEAVAREYGPIFRKDMPGHPHLVFITDPKDVEEMHRSTILNPIRPGMTSLKKVRQTGIFNGKAGILAEQGEEWWRVRSRVQKSVSSPRIVARYLPQMDQVAKDFVTRIYTLRDHKDEVSNDFLTELYQWSLEALGTITLDRRLGCLEPLQQDSWSPKHQARPRRLVQYAQQLLQALHDTENIKLWQYFPTASFRRLQEAHDIFTKVAMEAIATSEKVDQSTITTPSKGCPLNLSTAALPGASSAVVEALKNEEDSNPSLLKTLLVTPGLTREDVVTFIIDLLATGIDSPAHSVANMLYLLSRNPKAQAQVQREVDMVVDELGEHQLTPQHLIGLTYTRAAFKETLRLMPAGVGTTRRLERDTVLGGFLVPQGWQVVAPTMLINHQEAIFPRAAEFLPERFLKTPSTRKHCRSMQWQTEDPQSLSASHKFGFLPFSHGPRMCVGRRIAEQEVFTVLVRLMREFNVDYKYEDIHLINKLSYLPAQPLKFTFTQRQPNTTK